MGEEEEEVEVEDVCDEDEEENVTCRRSCHPLPPLYLSLSLLPFCCCTDHLLYIHLVEMNSLSPFFEKKTPSKPSSYPLHPLNLIILFYVIFFIFFFYFQFLSFCLLFSYHSLSPLSKSTACSYRMHLILPIVPPPRFPSSIIHLHFPPIEFQKSKKKKKT